MKKYLCYTRPDGGVYITKPTDALIMEFHLYGRATGEVSWHGEPVDRGAASVMSLPAAELAALAFVRARDIPADATNLIECNESTPLPNRRFRNAWRQAGAVPPVASMPAARTQRMGEVRVQRDQMLQKSDVDYMKAQEAGNTTLLAALRDYRQKLRDLPVAEQQNVDAITTPETLATWQPAWPINPATP